MKVLVLGASGFLGGVLYKKLKENTDSWVLGTYCNMKKDDDFIKLDVTNGIEVKTFLEHLNPDVVVWCLMGKKNEKQLIDEGMPNILNNIRKCCKIIFMSTNAVFSEGNGDFSEENIPAYKDSKSAIALYSNAKIDGEKLVMTHENHIIIRPGAIYGQDVNGKWDKRINKLIEDISCGKNVIKAKNMFNTFVEVNELSDAIIKLIIMDYKGIVHLGPEKKENYYDYFMKMTKKLKLNENLILPDYIDDAQAKELGVMLDTSLDTKKCRKQLGLEFSDII